MPPAAKGVWACSVKISKKNCPAIAGPAGVAPTCSNQATNGRTAFCESRLTVIPSSKGRFSLRNKVN